jgi:hypothetical protein
MVLVAGKELSYRQKPWNLSLGRISDNIKVFMGFYLEVQCSDVHTVCCVRCRGVSRGPLFHTKIIVSHLETYIVHVYSCEHIHTHTYTCTHICIQTHTQMH